MCIKPEKSGGKETRMFSTCLFATAALLTSFPNEREVTEAGVYITASAGDDFVFSGAIDGNVIISNTYDICSVTLADCSLAGSLTIVGDAVVKAEGVSSIANDGKAVMKVEGSAVLGGGGEITLSGGKTKTDAVLYATDGIEMAAGVWNIAMTYTKAKNGYGVYVANDFLQSGGRMNITSICTDYKDTGLYANKKSITLAGGILSVTMPGVKSVGIAANKGTTTIAGGVALVSMSGAAAKGVKQDGAFVMTDGLFSATISGDCTYEPYQDDDDNYYTVAYSGSSLLTAGTYVIEDVSAASAVKCGDVTISGGTVRIVASGVASRGLCADGDLRISGGYFDISAYGSASETVVELYDTADLTVTDLDRKTSACIKQGDTNGVAEVTGGVFYLCATNYGGKCFSVDGSLTVGNSGATTVPTDAAFTPDIQACTYGQKLYVGAQKLSAYTTLGTAVASTNLEVTAIAISTNSASIVTASGDEVDYTNPKAFKVVTDVVVNSGRIRMFSKCDGGEGLESKANLTVNGGVIEGTCYDDVVQASNVLTVNGGYLYCGSTGNDGIDANGSIVINDGVVLAFTTTTPEVGIDVDSSSALLINGGVVLAVGSATDMQYGSSGTQKSYLNTSASASTYAGQYLNIAGDYWVKVPALSSTSGSLSLMCSAPDCTGSAPTASSTAPTTGTAIGFHGTYE